MGNMLTLSEIEDARLKRIKYEYAYYKPEIQHYKDGGAILRAFEQILESIKWQPMV